jgi:hypothetical protein
MAYINGNPKTKKAAKELVKQGGASCFEPGPFGEIPYNGETYVEGPHYPQPHKWYGKVTIVNGKITKLS